LGEHFAATTVFKVTGQKRLRPPVRRREGEKEGRREGGKEGKEGRRD